MKKNPFLLVHSKRAAPVRGGASDALARLQDLAPEAAAMLGHVGGRLVDAVLKTAGVGPAVRPTLLAAGVSAAEAATLTRIGRELTRQAKVQTVGIWDLDAWVTRLQEMIDALNRAQPAMTFFEVQAAIPAGLISRPERVISWAEVYLREKLPKNKRDEMSANVIANDFFDRAEAVRKDLGLGYLIGITRAMIAGEEEDGIYWNHFSSGDGRLVLASTADLREFSREAGRPFEVAVASLVISALLAAMNPKLDFHDDRGCIFDYHQQRYTLVEELKKPKIEDSCIRLIRPSLRESARNLVQAVANYPHTAEL